MSDETFKVVWEVVITKELLDFGPQPPEMPSLIYKQPLYEYLTPTLKEKKIIAEEKLKMKYVDPEEPIDKGMQNRKWVTREEIEEQYPNHKFYESKIIIDERKI